MSTDDAKEAYSALSRMFKEFEANLDDGEYVGVSGVGPNSREFVVQQVSRVDNFVRIVGADDEDQFHQLIFAPSQVSLSLFAHRYAGKRQPIGFHQE